MDVLSDAAAASRQWRVDLHCHSRWSSDSRSTIDQIVDAVAAAGLDALALTDHDAIDGAFALRERAPFPVIVGEEIKTAEGEIIGLFLSAFIPPGLTPEETIDRIHGQGGLAYVPHPFDAVRGSTIRPAALERVADSLDAVEVFNARCLAPAHNEAAAAFARARGLPGGAGSDAHAAREIGRAYVRLPAFDPNDPRTFLAALGRAEVHGRPVGLRGRLAPGAAKAVKRLAAWRGRLAGPGDG